jgi:tRNA G18 (ribose-2'-O)-methylase SpoU
MLILAVETHRHKSIGTYLRCASAFGADTIAVVGSPLFSTHGAHGAQNHVQVVHFYYWKDCVEFCREKGCNIFAISPAVVQASSERIVGSYSVDSFVFSSLSACFIVGEKDGLTREQLDIADCVLHVDVPNATFADNVVYDSKVAICLHHFAVSTEMQAGTFHNEKHALGERNYQRPKTIKAGRNNAREAVETGDGYALSQPIDDLFS